MLHLILSASSLGTTAQCDHFFDGATTADIGHPVCMRDEPSKLDPGGRPVRVCRPAKVPKNLRVAAIVDIDALELELNAVGEPACPGARTLWRKAPALCRKAPAAAPPPAPSLASRS